MMRFILLAMTVFVSLAHADPVNEAPFIEAYPHLKDYTFEEPKSGIFFGLGVSPLGTLKDKLIFSADFFQVHYFSTNWDIEIMNVSYGMAKAQASAKNTDSFTFRAAPKFRIGNVFSVGPVVGYEFVNFPNLQASLFKDALKSTDVLFSEQGFIYGIMLSETFHYGEYLIQINEVGYQENYSEVQTPEGWHYVYNDPDVQANPSLIGPGFVTMIEVSFLF